MSLPTSQAKSLSGAKVHGKRVLMRVDFNVPLRNGEVQDDTRIKESLPSIKEVLEKGAKCVVLLSHLGRPKGEVRKELSLLPIVNYLEKHFPRVKFLKYPLNKDDALSTENARGNTVFLVENTRFYPGETKGDEELAKLFATLGDVFVLDAFGSAHRAHSSTTLISRILPSLLGRLVEKEIKFLSRIRDNPERPFVAVLGGAKISSKLAVLESLLYKADAIFLGGGMAYTFFLAQGIPVGKSIVEEDLVETASTIFGIAEERNVPLYLPLDVRVSRDPEKDKEGRIKRIEEIEKDEEGADIGPDTVREYLKEMATAKTIFWNGPMGIFEIPPFDTGTRELAEGIASLPALKVVGGGDSIRAIKSAGLESKFDHVSTGGGASLEFIEGKSLPALQAILG